VVPQIRSSLRFVPDKSHIRIVYTERRLVKNQPAPRRYRDCSSDFHQGKKIGKYRLSATSSPVDPKATVASGSFGDVSLQTLLVSPLALFVCEVFQGFCFCIHSIELPRHPLTAHISAIGWSILREPICPGGRVDLRVMPISQWHFSSPRRWPFERPPLDSLLLELQCFPNTDACCDSWAVGQPSIRIARHMTRSTIRRVSCCAREFLVSASLN